MDNSNNKLDDAKMTLRNKRNLKISLSNKYKPAEYNKIAAFLFSFAILLSFYIFALKGPARLVDMIFNRGLIPHTIILASSIAFGNLLSLFFHIHASKKSLNNIRQFISDNYNYIIQFQKGNYKPFDACIICGAKPENNAKYCSGCGAYLFDEDLDLISSEEKILKYFNKINTSRERNRINMILEDSTHMTYDYALIKTNAMAELDYDASDNYFSFTTFLAWTVPMLGFLGTVLGISQSLSNFDILTINIEDMKEIKQGLGIITQGLGIAFDTTILGIFFAIFISLFNSILNKWDKNQLYYLDRLSLDLLKIFYLNPHKNTLLGDSSFFKISHAKQFDLLESFAENSKQLLAEGVSINLLLETLKDVVDLNKYIKRLVNSLDLLPDLLKSLNRPKEFRVVEDRSKMENEIEKE